MYISEFIKEMIKQIRLESPCTILRHIHAKIPIYQLVGAQERIFPRNIILENIVLKVIFGKFIIVELGFDTFKLIEDD